MTYVCLTKMHFWMKLSFSGNLLRFWLRFVFWLLSSTSIFIIALASSCDVRFGLPICTFEIPFEEFPIVKWLVFSAGSGISKLDRREGPFLFRFVLFESFVLILFFGGLLFSWLFDCFMWTAPDLLTLSWLYIGLSQWEYQPRWYNFERLPHNYNDSLCT